MDIEEQYDKVYRYCYFRLRDRYLAQDITQETFLRFYRQEPSLDKGRELPYLYTIARNLCIDEFRRKRSDGGGGISVGINMDGFGAKGVSAGEVGMEAVGAGDFSAGAVGMEAVGAGDISADGFGIEAVRPEKAGMESAGRRKSGAGVGGMAAVSDSSEAWIDSMVLKAVIGKLPKEEQELLLLRYVNEVPMAPICKITGMSRFAVYRRLSKILRQLKKELIKEGFSE